MKRSVEHQRSDIFALLNVSEYVSIEISVDLLPRNWEGAPMNDIVRFEMNVPVELALKYAGPGKPIEGRYGNRVMYTLADNRVMYVAPIVASRISDLGIQPGEIFQVCKQEKKQGQRKVIEWQVRRLSSEPET